MLDEILEYEEYTCGFADGFPKRLRKGNLGNGTGENGFRGIPRALGIIARYAYFHKGIRDIDGIKYLLSLWCGFEPDIAQLDASTAKAVNEMDGLDIITNWLPEYLSRLYQEKTQDKEKILEKLKSKKKLWTQDPFRDAGDYNDSYSIYFGGIIADALDQGKLKKRYLVLKKDPVDGLETGMGEKDRNKFINDRGLKFIAAYQMNKIEDSDYACVNFANYSNWVAGGCDSADKVTKNDGKARVINVFKYRLSEDTPPKNIACAEYLLSDLKQNPVMWVDPVWREKYDPQVLTGEEILKGWEEKDYEHAYIFRDQGCGAPLERVMNKQDILSDI